LLAATYITLTKSNPANLSIKETNEKIKKCEKCPRA